MVGGSGNFRLGLDGDTAAEQLHVGPDLQHADASPHLAEGARAGDLEVVQEKVAPGLPASSKIEAPLHRMVSAPRFTRGTVSGETLIVSKPMQLLLSITRTENVPGKKAVVVCVFAPFDQLN